MNDRTIIHEPTLAIITPSYRNDLALCRDLHDSILRFAPSGTTHTIIVPKRDRRLFSGMGEVLAAEQLLPNSFLPCPMNMWINVKRPIPPVRGWIAQQIVKLAAAAASTADVVLLVDSDVVFIKPFTGSTFWRNGEARFYRLPGAIDARMPRHMQWHAVARKLLGLQPQALLTAPDYICWPMAWDPKIVRAMLAEVEDVSGVKWTTAICSELHFSEGMLYGTFVDAVLGGSPFARSSMLCAAYSDEQAFNSQSAKAFLATVSPQDIAVMISAKSGTDLATRREALATLDHVCGAAQPS